MGGVEVFIGLWGLRGLWLQFISTNQQVAFLNVSFGTQDSYFGGVFAFCVRVCVEGGGV